MVKRNFTNLFFDWLQKFLNFLKKPTILLVIVLSVLFLLLELKYNYYFLQDDNRDYSLPLFVHNYHSLQNGELALYNFHQFLGYSSFATGQSHALDPIAYLSTFLSYFFFHHYYATIDVYVIILLIGGAVGFVKFLKNLGLPNKAALFGGITWPLTSYSIYVSNSWIITPITICFLPCILACSIKFVTSPNRRIFLWLLLWKILFLYTGHPQYILYTLIFDLLFIILLIVGYTSKEKSLIKLALLYAINSITALFLALPIILPLWYSMAISAERAAALNDQLFLEHIYPIKDWLLGLFNPTILFSDTFHLVNLSFIGYLTIFFIITACVLYFKTKDSSEKNMVGILFLLFLIAFCLSTNEILLKIIYHIPILNRFRWSFKLNLFTNFFLISLSTFGFKFLSDKIKLFRIKNLILWTIISLQLISFAYLYLFRPPVNFLTHLDSLPLNEEWISNFKNDRIITVGNIQDRFVTTRTLHSAETLGYNYATLFNLYHFAGYDPMVPRLNNYVCYGINHAASFDQDIPLENLRTWGVKWYISTKQSSPKLFKQGLIPIKQGWQTDIYYDPNARDLFYWDDNDKDSKITSRITTNKIFIRVDNKKQQTLTSNFLFNPFFKATINNKLIEITPSKNFQTTLDVPTGEHDIIIEYFDPFFIIGCLIALSYLAFFVVVFCFIL